MQQQQDVEALRHLAILRILEAATLVWLHTKITEHSRRKDFPLLSDPYIADSYASSDGFGLVMKAYGEARDAIQALHRAGGKLEDAAYYLHDTRPTV
ncbi:hypothetical protein GGR51DRAFT_537468 [Nemania sp. FL0031]|nr:hypothetical protein GGR51DRAFT_537468 [Nemania sp. FL0031]